MSGMVRSCQKDILSTHPANFRGLRRLSRLAVQVFRRCILPEYPFDERRAVQPERHLEPSVLYLGAHVHSVPSRAKVIVLADALCAQHLAWLCFLVLCWDQEPIFRGA